MKYRVQTATGEARVGAGAAPGEPHSREESEKVGGEQGSFTCTWRRQRRRRAPGSSAPCIEAP